MLVRITTQCRVIEQLEQSYFSTVGSTHYWTNSELGSSNFAYTMTLLTP